MFKNAIIYRIADGWTSDLIDMEVSMGRQVFQPCGATQEKSAGWVPPRGADHGALVEVVAGQRIMRFQVETKSVPGQVVNRHLDERIAKIDQTEGRKPGRKEQRELRDEITLELLPHAFPKTASVWVWIDLKNRRLVLDTASQARADDVITALVQAIGLQVDWLSTQTAPQAAMTQWLVDHDARPEAFALGRQVELHSGDEMRSVVKFDRHHLDDDQMRLHISQGKLPTKLALDWQDWVSFVLTDAGALRKVEFLDVEAEDAEDGFDADVAIATGVLSELITALVDALGGLLDQEAA